MRATFQIFQSSFQPWEALFREAAEFASRLGTQRVISISHSEDQNDGLVVVWYWSDEESEPTGGFPLITDR